jgi:phage gp29-like protein
VIIDEAAFVDDLDELKKAAMALQMWGGCVRILSTHNGDDNSFNELVKDIRNGKVDYSLHHTTFDDAISQGLYERICLVQKKEWTLELQDEWRKEIIDSYGESADEELFCIPVRAGTRYFPSVLLEAISDSNAKVLRKSCADDFVFESKEKRVKEFDTWLKNEVRDTLLIHTNPIYLGEDFARSGDLTCIFLDELMPDGKLLTFLVIELRNVPFDQQWQTILYLMDTVPNFGSGACDVPMGRIKDFFKKKNNVPEAPAPNDDNQNEHEYEDDEQAYPILYTNRTPWADFSILNSLTPERLAVILADVRRGECPANYLELAQDIELKDLHYRSVLSTRKDAVTGLEIKVIPASDDKRDVEIADAVERDIVKNPKAKFRVLIRNMLDALAKGFSVNEIIWDTDSTWKPKEYRFRDPRWFQYDKESGTRLMLRAPYGNELEPLKPFHFVIHEPHLISGNQITAGLALPALYYWMLKSYDVTSWAAFIDRYGYQIRIDKYNKKFTEEDKRTLKRAVASIGQDFGAAIPESAELEIIESKHASETSGVYKSMADWIDKQISKVVLGQTMTTDDGASLAQSKTHEEVRDDIADSDIQQIIDTLNAALTVPYINLNFGEQETYPKIDLFNPDEKNIEQIISAVKELGPQGLKVKADEIRSLIGLSNPDDGDDVIGGKPEYTQAQADEGVSAIPAPLPSRAKRDMSNQVFQSHPILTETAAAQFP